MDGSLMPLLLIVLMGVAFWLLVIRPARSRQQEQSRLVSSLEPGARVLMASGIVGTVVALHDEDLEVEIAPGVAVTVVRQAILRLLDADAGAPAGTADASDQADEAEPGTTAEAPVVPPAEAGSSG